MRYIPISILDGKGRRLDWAENLSGDKLSSKVVLFDVENCTL